MTAPVVRLCLVGFGSIARTHASAIAALPAVLRPAVRPVLAALVSDRPSEVADDARALGIERVCTLDDALADPSLDAFDVTTRNVRHLPQARAILRSGRPLYVEKPIGRTAAEAAELAGLERAGGIPAQAGLVMRYDRTVVEARALIRAGAIGELRQARLGLFHGSYLDPARPLSWRLRAAEAGGGAMLDLGLHLVDLVRFLFGEAEVLDARHATYVPQRPDGRGGTGPVDVDDWAWAELGVPGGARVTVEASRIALGAEGAPFQVFGSEGSLVADLGAGPLRFRRFDGSEARWREAAADDPDLRAVTALLPPPRLTLGSFVDGHLGALHHFLLRVAGSDPAPGTAPTLTDSAVAEGLVEQIASPDA